MGVTSIGGRHGGSFGKNKINRQAVTDDTRQVDAAEYNRLADAVIELQEAVGTTVNPSTPSVEGRLAGTTAALTGLRDTYDLTLLAGGVIDSHDAALATTVVVQSPALRTITGRRRYEDGMASQRWVNASAFDLVLAHEDPGAATSADRLICPDNTAYVLRPGKSVTIVDDATFARTRIAVSDAARADTAGKAETLTGLTLSQAAAITLAHGTIVKTSGYRADRDGGAASYQYVAGDTATADGGAVVTAVGGRLRLLSAAGSGVNVMVFGAYNDGTHATETTAAFRAARDYASVTGSTIEAPAGRFLIAPDAANVGILFASHFRFRGASTRTVLVPAVASMTMIRVDVATTPQLTMYLGRFSVEGGATHVDLADTRAAEIKAASPYFIDRSSTMEDLELVGFTAAGIAVGAPMIGCQHRNVNMSGAGTYGVCGLRSVGAFLLHHTLWIGCRFAYSGAGGAGMWIEDPAAANTSPGQYGIVLHQCVFESNAEHGLLLKGARAIGYGCYYEGNGYGDVTLLTTYAQGGTTVNSYCDMYDATFDVAAGSQSVGGKNKRVRVLNHFCSVRLINCRSASGIDEVDVGGFGTTTVELVGTPGFSVSTGIAIAKRTNQIGLVELGIKSALNASTAPVGVNINGGQYGGGGLIIASRSVGTTSTDLGVYALIMGYSGNAFTTRLIFGRDVAAFSVDAAGNLLAASADGTNLGIAYVGSRA